MKILMVGPVEKAGGVSTHTKELTKSLKKLGIEVEIYNISPNKEYPKIISNLIKLHKRTFGVSIKLLKTGKNSDIVHIQSSGPLGGFIPAIVGAIWKKIIKFSLVITFHYSNPEKFVNRHEQILKFAIENTDKFILVSNKQKEIVYKVVNSQLKNKMQVIPNGYNPSRLQIMSKDIARRKLNVPDTVFVIVTVANLIKTKGHEYLIEAIKKLNHKITKRKIVVFIIGKGPMYPKLKKIIEGEKLGDVIKLEGWIPLEELSIYLNAADIFILPSLEEGNPTVMFEALGVGLPFIGTTVGGIPEIITSEDYGLLCPPKDPECLAEKILIALNKEWDREKIREYAEQFTWDNIAKSTVKIYENILNRR